MLSRLLLVLSTETTRLSLLFDAMLGLFELMIGSLFDLNSDSVKAAKLMRWEGSVAPSRLHVATSKPSSLLVGGHQLSVPPF